MTQPAPAAPPPLVWDAPTRLFHWSFAAAVIVALATGFLKGSWLPLHQGAGIAALGLVLFRLIWGVVGGRHARFASFVRGPGAALAHLRDLLRPGPLHAEPGHNPAGGMMVLVLLALVAAQAGFGLFTDDDVAFQGPLAKLVSYDQALAITSWHRKAAWVLLAAVVAHVGAVLVYRLLKGRDLVTPMLTGRDPALDPAHHPADAGGGLTKALMAAAVAVAALASALTLGR